MNTWIERQKPTEVGLKQLAAARHKEMAPVNYGEWHHRSKERISFCASVVERATKISRELVYSQAWRTIFNKDGKSDVRRHLLNSPCLQPLFDATTNLLKSLKMFAKENENKELSLVVVFDEASNLFVKDDSGKPQTGRYVALNRIFSCLNEFRVWFFVLSTESQVEKLLPPEKVNPDDGDASARRGLGNRRKESPLKIFPPFLALQLDVEDRRVMQSERRSDELSKAMAEFSKPEHMKMFGRPLWFAYTDPHEMGRLARTKLIGGKEGPYDPENVNHVFAALSFRISLDLCLENPRTLALARTAVNYHLRVVIAMHQNIEVLDTFTPSEPVLSEAAIHYLCEPKESEESRKSISATKQTDYKWSSSIQTLTQKLLQDGVIQKGLKGELYSRFVLILARDCVHFGASHTPKPTAPFTVQEFLMALYAEEHHKSICAIESKILRALMNFTHFTSTEENLHMDDIPELCHDLLRRSAALQLAPNQPTYDHLIPIYFGKADETFEPSKCGVILVQVKNKEKATTPSEIFREEFNYVSPEIVTTSKRKAADPTPKTGTPWKVAKPIPETRTSSKLNDKPLRETKYFCFDKMANPILLLLLDLGVAKPDASRVQVSCANSEVNPSIWAIHSQGHAGKVFGCLESMGCTEICEKFFTTAASGASDHDKLAYRNKVFHKLSRSFRYPEGGRVEADMAEKAAEKDTKTNEDEDIQMADA